MRNAIAINWTGEPLREEQRLFLHYAAAKHLREQGGASAFYLQHKLCEGKVTRKREGVFGCYAGTFFLVELGTVGGNPWTYEFLLLRGAEHYLRADEEEIDMVFAQTEEGVMARRIERQFNARDLELQGVQTVH
jgi:hypothetical protein